MGMVLGRFLSLKEGAALTTPPISVRTLKRWFKAGLPSYQPVPGGRIFLIASELEQFLTRRSRPQPTLDVLVEDAMHELVDAGRNGHGPNKQKERSMQWSAKGDQVQT